MSRERFDRLKQTGRLQPLSPTGQALHFMKRRGECVAAEVVDVLSEDPALLEISLTLANAARDGSLAPLRSATELVESVGPARARSLGLAFAVLLSNRTGASDDFDYDRFWSVGLAAAVSAFAIGEELGIEDATGAFLVAMLGRTGKLLLASAHPEEYARVIADGRAPEDPTLLESERATFELDHQELTALYLDDLGLSSEWVGAIREYSPIPRDWTIGPRLDDVYRVARRLARILADEIPNGGCARAELHAIRQVLGLDADTFQGLGDRIAQEWGEWGDLLRVPTVALPVFRDMTGEESALRGSTSEPAKVGRRGDDAAASDAPEQMRILAVDDDALTLRLLTRQLEAGGYRVIPATNGREALLAALHEDPHVVVADWMMPELDGVELCRALRRFDAGRRIFFILLTGRDEEERVLEAFEAGVDDFVTKPFRSKLLLARIRASERVVRLQRQVEIDKRLLRGHLAENRALTKRLREAAFTDVLTQLPNRRYAIQRLEEEWANSERRDQALSVILVDIDHFKKINDQYGHDVGDVVLRETAGVLDAQSREGESACRLGGEEFLVICPNSDLEESARAAERIRAAVEENLVQALGYSGSVTISAGVATRADGVVDVDNLVKLADEAVYRAKERGRNRVETWDPEQEAEDAA